MAEEGTAGSTPQPPENHQHGPQEGGEPRGEFPGGAPHWASRWSSALGLPVELPFGPPGRLVLEEKVIEALVVLSVACCPGSSAGRGAAAAEGGADGAGGASRG